MIRFRRKARRRSNLPLRPILYLVLTITAIEIVHVLSVDEPLYAQDTSILEQSATSNIPGVLAITDVRQAALAGRGALGDGRVGASGGRATVAGAPEALAKSETEGTLRIVAIYGPRSVRVGELANYRVRLADGAKRPVIYRWQMGDGTPAEGNNVAHRFKKPGRYTVVARVQNREGSDTESIDVVVGGNVIIPVPEVDDVPVAEGSGRNGRDGDDAPNVARTSGREAAPIPPRDAGFRGTRPLTWSGELYTLIVSTSSDRTVAERAAVDLRRRGFRSGIYLDDTGWGTPVYRVVVGEFAGEAEAVRGRQVLLSEGHPGAFIVHPMPQR